MGGRVSPDRSAAFMWRGGPIRGFFACGEMSATGLGRVKTIWRKGAQLRRDG
jgi:hypothetical protein